MRNKLEKLMASSSSRFLDDTKTVLYRTYHLFDYIKSKRLVVNKETGFSYYVAYFRCGMSNGCKGVVFAIVPDGTLFEILDCTITTILSASAVQEFEKQQYNLHKAYKQARHKFPW